LSLVRPVPRILRLESPHDNYAFQDNEEFMRTIIGRFAYLVKTAAIFSATVIFLTISVSAQQKSANDQIASAIVGLKQELKALNFPQQTYEAYSRQIETAEEALKSGYLNLTLEMLEQSWIVVKSNAYVGAHSEVEKHGNEAFTEEWQKVGKTITEIQSRLSAGESDSRPMLVRAFIDRERNSAPIYYISSKPYSENESIAAGLTYMGIALGELDFAVFCKQLRFENSRTQPKLRSLESELSSLDAEVIKGFHDTEGSEKQKDFITVSASMKQAGEMNQAGRYNGALYQYLRTALFFVLINAQPVTPDRLPTLKQKIESLAAQLKTKKDIDHSIGQDYLESAERILTQKAPADSDLKRAAVIADQILPRYLKYLSEEKH
jgi:hypothetical protein